MWRLPDTALICSHWHRYLEAEFSPLAKEGVLTGVDKETSVEFAYDFERIVDDFVFLCFFVGNDFLPHLPSLDIREGALDMLMIMYMRQLPSMGNYLTNGGDVNLSCVDIFLGVVRTMGVQMQGNPGCP